MSVKDFVGAEMRSPVPGTSMLRVELTVFSLLAGNLKCDELLVAYGRCSLPNEDFNKYKVGMTVYARADGDKAQQWIYYTYVDKYGKYEVLPVELGGVPMRNDLGLERMTQDVFYPKPDGEGNLIRGVNMQGWATKPGVVPRPCRLPAEIMFCPYPDLAFFLLLRTWDYKNSSYFMGLVAGLISGVPFRYRVMLGQGYTKHDCTLTEFIMARETYHAGAWVKKAIPIGVPVCRALLLYSVLCSRDDWYGGYGLGDDDSLQAQAMYFRDTEKRLIVTGEGDYADCCFSLAGDRAYRLLEMYAARPGIPALMEEMFIFGLRHRPNARGAKIMALAFLESLGRAGARGAGVLDEEDIKKLMALCKATGSSAGIELLLRELGAGRVAGSAIRRGLVAATKPFFVGLLLAAGAEFLDADKMPLDEALRLVEESPVVGGRIEDWRVWMVMQAWA